MKHGADILETKMDDAGTTVGEYLAVCLLALWREGEHFSGKRPLGNSDWQWLIYEAAAKAGFVEATTDEFGDIDLTPVQTGWIDELIQTEVRRLFGLPRSS